MPGNHTGLSGGSGSQTLETPFMALVRLLPPLACTENLTTFPVKHFLGTSLIVNQAQRTQKLRELEVCVHLCFMLHYSIS